LSQLVTGEAVALDLRTAALPSRMVAGLVDGLAQLVLLAVIGGIATAVSVDVSSAAAAALGIVVLVLVLIVYPVAFETLLRGRTPGKAAMGLRVVRDDGGPIGFMPRETELWRTYGRLRTTEPRLAMRKVRHRKDIYPVFRDLFRKGAVEQAKP